MSIGITFACCKQVRRLFILGSLSIICVLTVQSHMIIVVELMSRSHKFSIQFFGMIQAIFNVTEVVDTTSLMVITSSIHLRKVQLALVGMLESRVSGAPMFGETGKVSEPVVTTGFTTWISERIEGCACWYLYTGKSGGWHPTIGVLGYTGLVKFQGRWLGGTGGPNHVIYLRIKLPPINGAGLPYRLLSSSPTNPCTPVHCSPMSADRSLGRCRPH